jgi:hypothetical protein
MLAVHFWTVRLPPKLLLTLLEEVVAQRLWGPVKLGVVEERSPLKKRL